MSSFEARLTPEQRAVWDEMNPALQADTKAIAAKSDRLVKMAVMDRYEIGGVAKHWLKVAKYGDRAAARVAQVVHAMTEDDLYISCQVALHYTPVQMEKLLSLQLPNNRRFVWGHFKALSRIDSDKKRKSLEEKIIAEGLSASEAEANGQDARGGKQRATSGKKPVMPKSPQAAMSQVQKFGTDFDKRAPLWDKSLFQYVETAGPAQLNEDILTGLEQTKETLTVLQKQTYILLQASEAAIVRTRKVLEKKMAAAKEEELGGDAPAKAHESNGHAGRRKQRGATRVGVESTNGHARSEKQINKKKKVKRHREMAAA